MSQTEIIVAISIAVAIVGGVFFLLWWRKQKKRRSPEALKAARMQKMINTLGAAQVAPGSNLLLRARADLPREFLLAADRAWGMCLEAVRRRGWSWIPDPQVITILVFPSVRDFMPDGTYSPVFKVWIAEGDSYWGSIYDKGVDPEDPANTALHYMYAAEQGVSLKPEQPSAVIAQYTQDWAQCRNAIYFFFEHLLMENNNPGEHKLKVDHSQTGGHPIITEMSDEVNRPWVDEEV